jgi:hypothetical protein
MVFACPHVYNWEKEVIKKFEIIYKVEFIFADQIFEIGGSSLIIKKINDTIAEKRIDIVLFDTDFLPYIDSNIIQKVNKKVYKILLTFDNIVHGNLNLINGSFCNLVLVYDPLEVLIFRKYNINSLFFTLEDTKNSFKILNLKKDIDLLFYGDITKFGRKPFIDELIKRGVKIKVVGPPNNIVSDEEIITLINRSKIVLNLSFSNSFSDYNSFFPKSDNEINGSLLTFKGRFLHAGLCKTVCISDYAPSINLVYSNDEVPTFSSIDECIDLINNIINNDDLRIKLENNLYKKVTNEFDDLKLMNNIGKYIDQTFSDKTLINYKINKYYKKYITRFKIWNTLSKPVLLIKELYYLIKNGLFYFSFDFLKYYIITAAVILRNKIKNKNKNN